MKKLLITVFLCATIVPAYAANYTITGAIVGFSFDVGPFVGLQITNNFTPKPTFTGNWSIDTAALSLSGNLDFIPFSTHIAASYNDIPVGTRDEFYPHSQSDIDTSTASIAYNAATHTMTLQQVIFNDVGDPGICTNPTGILTCPTTGTVASEGNGSIDITLTFDSALNSFTGAGLHRFVHADGTTDLTNWSFSGSAVPIPSTLWLFGSGLLGLNSIRVHKTWRAG